jgi:hypothetical protein
MAMLTVLAGCEVSKATSVLGEPYLIVLEVTQPVEVGQPVPWEAQVLDEYGRPIPGEEVSIHFGNVGITTRPQLTVVHPAPATDEQGRVRGTVAFREAGQVDLWVWVTRSYTVRAIERMTLLPHIEVQPRDIVLSGHVCGGNTVSPVVHSPVPEPPRSTVFSVADTTIARLSRGRRVGTNPDMDVLPKRQGATWVIMEFLGARDSARVVVEAPLHVTLEFGSFQKKPAPGAPLVLVAGEAIAVPIQVPSWCMPEHYPSGLNVDVHSLDPAVVRVDSVQLIRPFQDLVAGARAWLRAVAVGTTRVEATGESDFPLPLVVRPFTFEVQVQ